MKFFKGQENILKENNRQVIKKDISKILSSSHLSFLLGAGCSANVISTMEKMLEKIKEEYPNVLENIPDKNKNIEKILEILFAQKFYLEEIEEKIEEEKTKIEKKISAIIQHIFTVCNCSKEDLQYNKTLEAYKSFYKKLMYRENALSKINIFTTNYDLFHERAMDDLGIIYTIDRYFNPMTFNYAYAEQIGLNKEKYNVLHDYVYLYKLHGSINWIKSKNNNSLFKIQEIQIPSYDENHIMIYPTPEKQSIGLDSPYSDLLREFQKKLLIQDTILVVIGYSFADEHINNIIYQALATISKFRLIIFSHQKIDTNEEIEKLRKKNDPRIWIITGTEPEQNNNENSEKNIADFKYIIDNFLSEENEEDKKLDETMLSHRVNRTDEK